jgi:hypothetical protein
MVGEVQVNTRIGRIRVTWLISEGAEQAAPVQSTAAPIGFVRR